MLLVAADQQPIEHRKQLRYRITFHILNAYAEQDHVPLETLCIRNMINSNNKLS